MATRTPKVETDDILDTQDTAELGAAEIGLGNGPIPDSDDDMPDEFSTDEPDSTSLATEALNESIFGKQQYEDDFQKINPPKGDWIKDGRWETYKLTVDSADSQPGDVGLSKTKPYSGRTYYSINGRPTSRTVEGVEHAPALYFRMSPDRRLHPSKAGEYDFSYKMFIEAKQLYLSIHGEQMKSEGQLKYMLEEDSYVLNTGIGDSGLIVYHIKPKRAVK